MKCSAVWRSSGGVFCGREARTAVVGTSEPDPGTRVNDLVVRLPSLSPTFCRSHLHPISKCLQYCGSCYRTAFCSLYSNRFMYKRMWYCIVRGTPFKITQNILLGNKTTLLISSPHYAIRKSCALRINISDYLSKLVYPWKSLLYTNHIHFQQKQVYGRKITNPEHKLFATNSVYFWKYIDRRALFTSVVDHRLKLHLSYIGKPFIKTFLALPHKRILFNLLYMYSNTHKALH